MEVTGLMEAKRCKRCQGLFEGAEVEAFFRARGVSYRSLGHRNAVCIGCELTARTERKRANRPREKARRTRDHHADKYIRLGQATSREDFVRRYHWPDIDEIAHDIDHTAANGCCYCRRPFAEMEHGLADVTLDVIDPKAPPYYRSNARWCCRTCNTEKARTPPHLWGAKLAAWEKWRRWHENEFPPDSLFGDWS